MKMINKKILVVTSGLTAGIIPAFDSHVGCMPIPFSRKPLNTAKKDVQPAFSRPSKAWRKKNSSRRAAQESYRVIGDSHAQPQTGGDSHAQPQTGMRRTCQGPSSSPRQQAMMIAQELKLRLNASKLVSVVAPDSEGADSKGTESVRPTMLNTTKKSAVEKLATVEETLQQSTRQDPKTRENEKLEFAEGIAGREAVLKLELDATKKRAERSNVEQHLHLLAYTEALRKILSCPSAINDAQKAIGDLKTEMKNYAKMTGRSCLLVRTGKDRPMDCFSSAMTGNMKSMGNAIVRCGFGALAVEEDGHPFVAPGNPEDYSELHKLAAENYGDKLVKDGKFIEDLRFINIVVDDATQETMKRDFDYLANHGKDESFRISLYKMEDAKEDDITDLNKIAVAVRAYVCSIVASSAELRSKSKALFKAVAADLGVETVEELQEKAKIDIDVNFSPIDFGKAFHTATTAKEYSRKTYKVNLLWDASILKEFEDDFAALTALDEAENRLWDALRQDQANPNAVHQKKWKKWFAKSPQKPKTSVERFEALSLLLRLAASGLVPPSRNFFLNNKKRNRQIFCETWMKLHDVQMVTEHAANIKEDIQKYCGKYKFEGIINVVNSIMRSETDPVISEAMNDAHSRLRIQQARLN